MKDRIYLRIGKDKGHLKFAVSNKPNYDALAVGPRVLPTILATLDVEVPDSEFEATRIHLETRIESGEPAVNIRQINRGEEDEARERNMD